MNKRKALGKGLEALIPDLKEDNDFLASVPLNDILPNPHQPRHSFNPQKIDELAQTILDKGIFTPLLVRKNENKYELISGERRLRAAKKAGLKEVPVIIKEYDSISSFEISLIENIQREDLNPIEEAEAYNTLISFSGYNHEALSKKLGKDRSTITNSLRLLNLPKEIKDAIIQGAISSAHGRTLLSLKTPDEQIKAFYLIMEKGLSVRETEKIIKNYSSEKKSKNKPIKDIHLNSIENELKHFFSTQVKISKSGKKGKISIEFYSLDDLERILSIIRERNDY
jgi:ParB family chromosome partitioning protein